MTCILCAHWNQDDPNCGHGLIDGLQAPAKWFTFAFVMMVEVGEMPLWLMAGENSRAGRDLIARHAHRAGQSVWKVTA